MENNIDNYVRIINNKNVVNSEMTEVDNQPNAIPNGFGGCKTAYVERKDFEDKAKAAYIPPKEKFAKTDRISTAEIKALSQSRC